MPSWRSILLRGFWDSGGEDQTKCCSGLCPCTFVDPNGAVWSHTAPKHAACINLSLSPGTGPKESHCLQLVMPDTTSHPRAPSSASWPAAGDGTVMDCSIYTSSQGGNARSCRAPSAVSSRQGSTEAMLRSGC